MATVPHFPALDDWQKMSEGDQDALIESIEAAHRCNARNHRLITLGAGIAICAAAGFALHAMLPG